MLLPETNYGHCSTGTLAHYTMVIFSVRGSQVEQKSSLCSPPPPLLCGHHAGWLHIFSRHSQATGVQTLPSVGGSCLCTQRRPARPTQFSIKRVLRLVLSFPCSVCSHSLLLLSTTKTQGDACCADLMRLLFQLILPQLPCISDWSRTVKIFKLPLVCLPGSRTTQKLPDRFLWSLCRRVELGILIRIWI